MTISNPVAAIRADRTQARQLGDTNADICFLALADAGGRASVRTLVLRDIRDNRFTLFINKSSPKWKALADGAGWELLLWYSSVQRQYRISGEMQELDPEVVRTNWQRRPIGSKYLDYLYESLGDQSSPIASRDVLTRSIGELKQTLDPDAMQAPSLVAGVELIAGKIEILDLNKEDRIHDRRLFTFTGSRWEAQVLIP